jgi:acetyltransferase-like isoleucine patch superfamily enzyme
MPLLGKLKTLALTGLSPIWRIYLQLRGVKVGGGFTCIGRPGVNFKRGSKIHLGRSVTLCNSGMANPLAEGGRCRLATVASGAELIIHDQVGMSSALVCCATRVEIGSGTIIGGGAMIIDTDFHPRLPNGTWGTDPKSVSKPVKIGKNCFIGARAVILKGVTIGDGAMIGAGALVTRNVPESATAAGNPARVLPDNAH